MYEINNQTTKETLMNFKRFLSAILCAALLLTVAISFVSCNATEEEEVPSEKPSETVAETEAPTEKPTSAPTSAATKATKPTNKQTHLLFLPSNK